MRALITTGLILLASSAYGVAPTAPEAPFESSTSAPIEFVSHQARACDTPEQFQKNENQENADDLMMGILLAAKESGITIEIVEEHSCFGR